MHSHKPLNLDLEYVGREKWGLVHSLLAGVLIWRQHGSGTVHCSDSFLISRQLPDWEASGLEQKLCYFGGACVAAAS